ncbi:MAG: hypothetical protein UU87_C0002G0112 [Parcubacteria group bacterium GW2011_GWA2_42_11]|nr:MAG: hypothetical protein UU87_C0002G0112 [Parcubacteria group bacterium GW2011_GWA2_42_11]
MSKLIISIRKNKVLAAILLASFVLCLAYSFYFQIKPQVDASAYDVMAQNIANGFGYREGPLNGDLSRDLGMSRVGPLYQYFLAGIYKVFGHNLALVWIVQALMHAATAGILYLTALLVFAASPAKRKIALWAAGILAFYPDLIENAAMLLTETFYLFLVSLMIYFFFRCFYQKNIWLPLTLGLFSGLACLARPPVVFFLPIVIFYFVAKKQWRPLVLFFIALILVFTPWTIRNYSVFGEFMPFSAAGNFNFWIGNFHGANGEQEPQKIHYEYMQTHNLVELQAESMNQFKSFLREHPLEFIKLTLLRANKYFSILRPMGFWFYQQGWGQFLFLLFSGLASILLFVAGFGGMIKSIKIKKETIYYLAAFAIATPLIIFITVVETRYRFQIYPFLAIFAGFFIVELWQKRKWWQDRLLWLVAGLIFSNGLIDLFLSWAKFAQRLDKFI